LPLQNEQTRAKRPAVSPIIQPTIIRAWKKKTSLELQQANKNIFY
jgi:hypothetical protein